MKETRNKSNIPYMLPGESMKDTRERLGEFIPQPKLPVESTIVIKRLTIKFWCSHDGTCRN